MRIVRRPFERPNQNGILGSTSIERKRASKRLYAGGGPVGKTAAIGMKDRDAVEIATGATS